MYYNIVESGLRIRKLRTAAGMTRQSLAEEIGISVDALRKIETGANGARIDTLVETAEIFGVSLDYLVCGNDREAELDGLFAGLKESEKQFIRNMAEHAIKNMILLRK